MNKRLVYISAALCSFVLVFLGAVFAKMQDRNPIQTPQTQLEVVKAVAKNAETSTPISPATIEQNPMPEQKILPPLSQPMAQISSDRALQIAQNAQPSARVQSAPELVKYGGLLAYEVSFAQGKMYINANTGVIVGNGIAQAAPQPSKSLTAREHKYEHDDDDDEDEHEHRGEHREKKREHKQKADDYEEREDA